MTQVPNTTAATGPSYQALDGDPVVDRDAVLALWRHCGLAPIAKEAAARYDWFYLQNPAGKAQVNLLTAANSKEHIGFLGVGARNFCIAGESQSAGVLVDFVVDPKHRIAMPALMLQRYGQQRALQSMAVLYGIPDTKAVAIMNRLGNHVRFDLPLYARVLRSRPYLQRHMPSWCATPLALCVDSTDRSITGLRLLFSGVVGEWLDEFDARFDRLWEAVPKQKLCIGVRDREFLRWRFTDQQDKQFRIFAVRRVGADDLCSYFVCELLQGVVTVKDCLHVGSEAELRDGLLLLSSAARRAGATSVSLQVTPVGDFPRALRMSFFRQRSKRMFFAVANPSVRDRCVATRWYVTPADEDV